MQAGDRVLYVPGEDHAWDRFPDGSYAYRFALTRSGEELSGGQIAALRRENGVLVLPGGRSGGPVHLAGPRRHWPAVVEAAHADGTVDLAVTAPIGCVTLHVCGVRRDEARAPGTCHLPDAQG